MTKRDLDRRVNRLARDQHGAFSWAQARSLGVTAGMAARRTRNGEWLRPARSVYLVAAAPTTWRQAVKAAELSLPGSAVGGSSALELYGLPGGNRGVVRLTVPSGSSGRTPLAIVRRSDLVTTTRVDGFRVVTPEQAAFDVAGGVSTAELERIVEGALLEGRTSTARLERRLAALDGSRLAGIDKIRAVILDHGAGLVVPESELERLLYRALDLAEVPGVIRQATPPWKPHSRERLDALAPGWRVVFEADGRRWHARREAMERDRRRDHEAAANGFLVLRFTWAQLTSGLDEVVEIIRATGAWRAAA